MNAQHTPTPWFAEIDQHDNALCINSKSDGEIEYFIARMIGGYLAEKADAAFIVLACNGWDNVDALRTRIAELEGAV